MAKKEPQTMESVTEKLRQELASRKLTLVKLVDDLDDMSVTCIPTRYPQVNVCMRTINGGIPMGRDVEIFSKEPELGKTSIGLDFIADAQATGLRVAVFDLERTITKDFLQQRGVITDPNQDPTKYAVFMVRYEDETIPAEDILETLHQLSKCFDVILVDSVAALEAKADLAKEAGEEGRLGGVSKMLSAFLRRNAAKRACVIWINQTRMKTGPMGGYTTTGGRGLPFWASIRICLNMAFPNYKVEDSTKNVIATRVEFSVDKNKIGPQFRKTILTYILGLGFSVEWDYLEMALSTGVVKKGGAWFSIELPKVPKVIDAETKAVLQEEIPAGEFKRQGQLAFVRAMREKEHPLLMETIRKAVDGEDVAAPVAA